jgi:hypothetical protein
MKTTVIGLELIKQLSTAYDHNPSIFPLESKINEIIRKVNLLIELEEERLNNTFTVLKETK